MNNDTLPKILERPIAQIISTNIDKAIRQTEISKDGEIDRAITVYKKQAVDMCLSIKEKVRCKIILCLKTYYHYAFELSSEICKMCAELNIGIMVYF